MVWAGAAQWSLNGGGARSLSHAPRPAPDPRERVQNRERKLLKVCTALALRRVAPEQVIYH